MDWKIFGAWEVWVGVEDIVLALLEVDDEDDISVAGISLLLDDGVGDDDIVMVAED